jgi:Glucose inhibited division protein A
VDCCDLTDSAHMDRVRPRILVVGAGVSGCACAAALASAGFRVTLMNSAMDRVGLPAYGPDLLGEDGGWERLNQVLDLLPASLRMVWLQAAMRPTQGEPVLNIDRRRVSIETKRVLERLPGLQFRQGFVTDLRLVPAQPTRLERQARPDLSGHPDSGAASPPEARLDSRSDLEGAQPGSPGGSPSTDLRPAADRLPGVRAEVETIFGEVFEADAVVLAVGLSLGSTIVGSGDPPSGVASSGRYGEPASDGLRAALDTLGVEFRVTALEVGPRISVEQAEALGLLSPCEPGPPARGSVDAMCSDDLRREGLVPALAGESQQDEPSPRLESVEEEGLGSRRDDPFDSWPTDYPPAPHWQADLRLAQMVFARRAVRTGEQDEPGGQNGQNGQNGQDTQDGRYGQDEQRGDSGRFPVPALSPDGMATSEVYLALGSALADEMGCAAGGELGLIATRTPLVVEGMTVGELDGSGRIVGAGLATLVWVVGRCAGARDYVDSLASAVRAAEGIAQWLDQGSRPLVPLKNDGGQQREGAR